MLEYLEEWSVTDGSIADRLADIALPQSILCNAHGVRMEGTLLGDRGAKYNEVPGRPSISNFG